MSDKIASELVKVAQDLIAADAADDFKRQSDLVNRNLKRINDNWKRISKAYAGRLKRDPNNWTGVGRGSEMGDLVNNTDSLATRIERINPR